MSNRFTPFLLSKEAIEKSDIKIDFAKDKVSFLNRNIGIVFTPTGHYAMPTSKMAKLLDHIYFC